MKIFKKENVYESALDRIRYLFDEFPNIIVGFSGGKDSVVTLELALIIAKEKDRLPLKVLFIDQEAEWKGTIDIVAEVMEREEVEPLWFQMPIVITNNASSYERYSKCWDEKEEDKWIHPKHPISIKENNYGTDRFHDLFGAILKKDYLNDKTCYLAGVRGEEAPKRMMSLTSGNTYKGLTYGKVLSKKLEHYTLYPLYDWSYTDIWKAIHENKWKYNRIYDEMYRHQVSVNDMRISNVHHETAIQSLLLIQEIEPETWVRLTNRVDGVNTIKHLKGDSFKCPKELPYMFENWEEYAYHLIEHIIQDDANKDSMRKKLDSKKEMFSTPKIYVSFWKVVINTILSSDWDYTKWRNWEMQGAVLTLKRVRNKGEVMRAMVSTSKFLEIEDMEYLLEKIKEK